MQQHNLQKYNNTTRWLFSTHTKSLKGPLCKAVVCLFVCSFMFVTTPFAVSLCVLAVALCLKCLCLCMSYVISHIITIQQDSPPASKCNYLVVHSCSCSKSTCFCLSVVVCLFSLVCSLRVLFLF